MKRPLALAALMLAVMMDMYSYGYPSTWVLSAVAVLSFGLMLLAAVKLNRWYIAPAVTSIGFSILLLILVNTPCPNR